MDVPTSVSHGTVVPMTGHRSNIAQSDVMQRASDQTTQVMFAILLQQFEKGFRHMSTSIAHVEADIAALTAANATQATQLTQMHTTLTNIASLISGLQTGQVLSDADVAALHAAVTATQTNVTTEAALLAEATAIASSTTTASST